MNIFSLFLAGNATRTIYISICICAYIYSLVITSYSMVSSIVFSFRLRILCYAYAACAPLVHATQTIFCKQSKFKFHLRSFSYSAVTQLSSSQPSRLAASCFSSSSQYVKFSVVSEIARLVYCCSCCCRCCCCSCCCCCWSSYNAALLPILYCTLLLCMKFVWTRHRLQRVWLRMLLNLVAL